MSHRHGIIASAEQCWIRYFDTFFLGYLRCGGLNEMFANQIRCVSAVEKRSTVTWCVIRSLSKAAQRACLLCITSVLPVPVLRVVWHDTSTYLYLTGRWQCSTAAWFRKRVSEKLGVCEVNNLLFLFCWLNRALSAASLLRYIILTFHFILTMVKVEKE